jgi:hypothetical protein
LCGGTAASNHDGPSLFGLYASALVVNTNGLFPLTINLFHGIDLMGNASTRAVADVLEGELRI